MVLKHARVQQPEVEQEWAGTAWKLNMVNGLKCSLGVSIGNIRRGESEIV